MKTGNRKWNGNGNKNAPIVGAEPSCHPISGVLCRYSCIVLRNVYITGFMNHALCLYSCILCFVITY